MRCQLVALLASAAAICGAVDVGILDNTRLYTSSYNVQSGQYMVTMKGLWEARGAVWHQTGQLTPAFLATVTVFYTSQIGAPELSADEQTALVNWVRAGNTLIVTGDCG
jgi:hypothetical protein